MKTKLLFLATVLLSLMTNAQTVHLTGAGVGGWNNPPLAQNLLSTTDNITYTRSNVQITGSGGTAEFKFMINSDWNTTFGFSGSASWPSGTANSSGNNIVGVAGFWNVTYNRTTGAYSFSPGVNPNPTITINNSGTPIGMTTTDGINYVAPSSTITAGNFTFAQSGTSTVWGNPAFPAGTATIGGSPVVARSGTYNIAFNRNTGTYNFVTTAVSMVGPGSPSASWDTDAPMTTTNAINYTINNAVLATGNLKIRDNGSWTFQHGANGVNTFPNATMIQNGGDFAVVAGTYNIAFNRSTGVISFAAVTANTNTFIQDNFNIMPNPTSNVWSITSKNNEITAIQIFDIVGKQVFSKNINMFDYMVDASNYNKGVYFAKISTNEGTGSIKLVKN